MADAAQVTELIKKIASDGELRSQLTAADDAERVVILEGIGYGGITAADIAASAGSFVPEVQEMDDAELAGLAGGGDTITTTTTTTTVTASASAAVAT